MKNIIDAISTIVKRNIFVLTSPNVGNNRANNRGDALELYVKNLFADTFDRSEIERLEIWSKAFSWLGNASNPPDFMLRNGDAVEVKKIESPDVSLALNSSPPKQKLKSSSLLISRACHDAEIWTEKDIIYTVGVVNGNRLKHLCMVYGRDYCASEAFYEQIRWKAVDPLGITYLRIRGMWHIENPWRVFDYIYQRNFQAEFNFMCLIGSEKWDTLENRNELFELQKNYPALSLSDVKIKNPDNPAKLKEAKLISYVKEHV